MATAMTRWHPLEDLSELIEPRSGRLKPAIRFSSVLLPDPGGPVSETNSFEAISSETSRSAATPRP